jgi:type I restriction enzyme R subunit
MFCVSSVDTLIKYYDLFKAKKEAGAHNLNIATIFSYTANEDERKDTDSNGFIPDDLDEDSGKVNKHSRDKLEEYIVDYNKMFNTKYHTKDSEVFYNYYKDIGKRVKNKQIDILLVVNMFLTGFDSKPLNTLYVDKNLKYHGLIQAYSRTNRILDEVKSQGNIVCFRNLKEATDQAIALFANKNAKEVIFMKPFEDYVAQFNKALEELKAIAPTVADVKNLQTEDDELEFVQAFRELMRLKNVLTCFSDFSFDTVEMDEQEFNDYKSAYLDLWQKVKTDTEKEKVSVLDDVDFELELLHRDEINVAYILALLAKLKDTTGEEYERQRTAILNMLGGEAQLRSKKELIERFITENLPQITDSEDVQEQFDKYWNDEQKKAFDSLLDEEQLKREQMEALISKYLYEGRPPLRDELFAAREEGQPTVMQRKTVYERIIQKLTDFVETFINGMGG